MTMYAETECSLQTDMTFLFAAHYKIRRIYYIKIQMSRKTTITSSSPEEGSVTY
jgi:hypothetical protein